MRAEIVSTQKAAAPAAHYSQGYRVGQFVYTAGCVGVDPETGALASGGFDAQTRRTLNNVAEILAEAGASLEHVIKTNCFVKHAEDFSRFDSIYREFFPDRPPVRTTIVSDLVKDEFLVEVEVVAFIPE